jgi:hypothetical protein
VRRSHRRSNRATGGFVTVDRTWSAFVDGRLVMDGCATRAEALEYATRAAQ